MKKFRLIIWILVLSLALLTLSHDAKPSSFSHEVVYGELMIKVQNQEEASSLANQYHLEIISISSRGLALFKVYDEQIYDELLEKGFAANSIYHKMAPPWTRPSLTNDPLSDKQFSLTMMDTPKAWALTTGDENVLIAIIDSGIDVDHEEFVGRISPLSYNSAKKLVGTQYINDTDGHGTMVAGLIAANKNNQKGIAGIVEHSQLLVIKASEDDSDTYTDAAIIEGIYYAVENGAQIINISLGGTYANPNTRDAVNYALDQGVIIVAASGNDANDTPIYPAAFRNTISVGSVDNNKVLSDFSSYGQTIDVVSFGDDVLTTGLNNSYFYVYGTSFAAPQVTGVIALMMSYNPSWTAQDIITRIRKTATDLGEFGRDDLYGHGLVNTYDALTVELIEIHFNVDGGVQITSMFTAKDRTFKVDTPVKAYHTFEGWYVDQTFDTPFLEGVSSFSQNQTLYARFEPFKYTVTFVTEGISIEPFIVDHGTLLTLPNAIKEGHTFKGWFLDPLYRFKLSTLTITEDLTLYAKFEINTYTINFVTYSEPIDSLQVEYMAIPSLPIPTKENYVFEGWYLDQSLLEKYQNEAITESMTLYAKFVEPIYYIVSFQTEGPSIDDLMVLQGTTFQLPSTNKEQHIFMGWYEDSEFLVLYETEVVIENITLYAKFVPVTYEIRFFDADGTIIEIFEVQHNQSFVPTLEVSKESTDALSFIFMGWDQNLDDITQELDVYPIFEFTYNPNIIRIAQGLDTIFVEDTWQDGGLNLNDPNIQVMIRSNLNNDQAGTYVIYYDLFVFDIHIDTLLRVVNVRPNDEEVVISLKPSIATIYEGQSYIDQGATTNVGTIETEGIVDTNTPGIYQIVYKVTHQNRIYQRSRFVHVLMNETNQNDTETAYFKEEKWWKL
jgi:uncharacterized repeat protein (TIGR02543 family)